MSNLDRFDPSPPEYPPALAARIISRFDLPRPRESFDFLAKGNINQHTFLIRAGLGEGDEYLLQRINQQVFVKPRSVMAAMMRPPVQLSAVAARILCRAQAWRKRLARSPTSLRLTSPTPGSPVPCLFMPAPPPGR